MDIANSGAPMHPWLEPHNDKCQRTDKVYLLLGISVITNVKAKIGHKGTKTSNHMQISTSFRSVFAGWKCSLEKRSENWSSFGFLRPAKKSSFPFLGSLDAVIPTSRLPFWAEREYAVNLYPVDVATTPFFATWRNDSIHCNIVSGTVRYGTGLQ